MTLSIAVCIVALFAGMIIWLQVGIEIARYGEEELLGDLVAQSFARGFGPFMTCIILVGAVVSAYDPVAIEPARRVLRTWPAYADTMRAAVVGSDAVVVVTRWKEFEGLPSVVSEMPVPPLVFDGRRMLDRGALPRYDGIGL